MNVPQALHRLGVQDFALLVIQADEDMNWIADLVSAGHVYRALPSAVIRSAFRYSRSGSGTTTLPSACW